MRNSKYFSTVVTVFVIIGVILFLAWATVIRDYTFKQVGGSWMWVARISVPSPSSVSIDTSEEERLTVKCASLGAQVHSYEFQISPFQSMAFAKVYGTTEPRQTVAGLKGGKKYYVRARAIKLNSGGRRVHGRWTTVRSAKVKEKKK